MNVRRVLSGVVTKDSYYGLHLWQWKGPTPLRTFVKSCTEAFRYAEHPHMQADFCS
jgi:hypothetical protein